MSPSHVTSLLGLRKIVADLEGQLHQFHRPSTTKVTLEGQLLDGGHIREGPLYFLVFILAEITYTNLQLVPVFILLDL